MSNENYSNTWVSVKGTKSLIKNNKGKFSVLDGFSVNKNYLVSFYFLYIILI
jgi:hypothetical protein